MENNNHLRPFSYTVNEKGNYNLICKEKVIAELFVSEDDVRQMVIVLNHSDSEYDFEKQ